MGAMRVTRTWWGSGGVTRTLCGLLDHQAQWGLWSHKDPVGCVEITRTSGGVAGTRVWLEKGSV